MLDGFVDGIANRGVGFPGGGGDFDIVACGGKRLVGIQDDEQEDTRRDGVGGKTGELRIEN